MTPGAGRTGVCRRGCPGQVNAVLHPLVRREIRAWVESPGCGLRAAVIPLLFEVGWADDWDVIPSVWLRAKPYSEAISAAQGPFGRTGPEAYRRAQMRWRAARSHPLMIPQRCRCPSIGAGSGECLPLPFGESL